MGVRRRFEGRRCLVAGAGSSADAVARRLQGEGATLARLGSAEPLTTEDGATAAVRQALESLRGLDVVVTAFRERDDKPFLELDGERWARTLDRNLKAAFLVSREAARAMAEAGGGVIVHVGSDVAARPGPGTCAYAAAQAGLHLLTVAMALDLAPDGVRVCGVAACEAPGEGTGVGTPDDEDLAAAVAFCASEAASYVLGSTFYLAGPLPVRS